MIEPNFIDLSQYVVRCQNDRWIVVLFSNEGYGWSGFRWVPIGGSVGIYNFDSENAAHAYAMQVGLTPAAAPSDDQIKTIWRNVANGVGSQGDFLRWLGSAIVNADPENFPILRPVAIFFINKYQLEKFGGINPLLPISTGKEDHELEKTPIRKSGTGEL
jgi:hypothetical protein